MYVHYVIPFNQICINSFFRQKGRHSWDPLSVLFAVRGFENYCEKVHGRNEIFNYQASSKSVAKAFLADDKIEYDSSDTIEIEDIIYGYNRWIKSESSQDFYLSWKNEDCKEKARTEINNLILGNEIQTMKHSNKL